MVGKESGSHDGPVAVFLTAIPAEYTAVRAFIEGPEEQEHKGTLFETGRFSVDGKAPWQVVVAELGEGNENAAALTERAIERFRPSHIFFLGVAGGVKDVKLGDVVAATKVYGYEGGKAERDFKPRPDLGAATHQLEQRARAVSRKKDWIRRILPSQPEAPPFSFVKPIASGGKVVADTRSPTYAFIRQQYGDAVAVEMEGIGFFKAVNTNTGIQAIEIRGISDLIVGKTQADRSGWQERAAAHAAAFAFEMLACLAFPSVGARTSGKHAGGKVLATKGAGEPILGVASAKTPHVSFVSPAVGDDQKKPMTTNPGLTILHLSDIQIGKNHRFKIDPKDEEEAADTLLERLKEDLDALREEVGGWPDIVIMTGDLAEWALPSEFRACARFVNGLLDHVGLQTDRLALVPGNHDINRNACEAYFKDSQANEQDPKRPYWPKWRNFHNHLFQPVYEGWAEAKFGEEEPWSIYELPDLKVVVAGLNSTYCESHKDEDHYGWVGEPQLKWFQERLGRYKDEGWLRIGAVHHNVRRGAQADNENLRDEDQFRQRLVDTSLLNLVLHGHTHDGKIDWWSREVPILATGSVGLEEGARPNAVPNQYQVIRVHRDGMSIWARRFEPDRKRFEGDNRVSKNGDDWRRHEAVSWVDAPACFGEAEASPADPEGLDPFEPLDFQQLLELRVTEELDLLPELVSALCRQLGGADVAAEMLAKRLCRHEEARWSIAQLASSAPQALRQVRQARGEDIADALGSIRMILGWLLLGTVNQPMLRDTLGELSADEGFHLEVSLREHACVEIVMAFTGKRAAMHDFAFSGDQVRGEGAVDLSRMLEMGYRVQDRVEGIVRVLWKLAYDGTDRPPLEGKTSKARADHSNELDRKLDKQLKEEGRWAREFYLMASSREDGNPLNDPDVISLLRERLPSLKMISFSVEGGGGFLVRDEYDISAMVRSFLKSLKKFQS